MDRERIKGMSPESIEAYASLLRQKDRETAEEEDRRLYAWVENTDNINFWEFRKKNYSLITGFQISEDVVYTDGWKAFAEILGLDFTSIQHCERYAGLAGPTNAVFAKMEEKKEFSELTLKDVLSALIELGQHEMFTRFDWQKCIEKYRKKVVKPVVKEGCEEFMPVTFSTTIKQSAETLVCSSNEGMVNDAVIKKCSSTSKCDVKILLVYASDARSEALQVVEQLRNPRSERGIVGVLLLTEEAAQNIATQMRIDPWNSIHKWFKQVRFVVPVLSPQFLQQIQNRDRSGQSMDEKLYNRYVYRLTLDDYVSKMSRNIKCRAIYPTCYQSEIVKSELVRGNGLLQIHWSCSTEESVEKFAKILIEEAKSL